jgi:GNAT superfamily N-acetyltransferase
MEISRDRQQNRTGIPLQGPLPPCFIAVMFCVADDWQRRGLGSLLISLLVDTAVTDAMRWRDGVIPEQAPFATIYLHAG